MEILVFDTSYVQDRKKKNTGKKNFLFSFLALFLSGFALVGGVISAFSISTVFWMLVAGLAVFSLFFTWFYLDQRLDGKRFLAGLGLVVLLGGFCFFWQASLIRGFYSVANSVIRKINQVYAGNLNTLEASGGTVLFFMVLIFIITGILGAFMVKEQKWLPVLAVFFPVFALTAAGRKAGKCVALFASDDPFADFYCCKKPSDGMEVWGSSCGDRIGGVCACLVYRKTFVRYFHPPVVQGRNKDTEPFSPVIMADPA